VCVSADEAEGEGEFRMGMYLWLHVTVEKIYSVKITVQHTTCAEKIFLFWTDLDLNAILLDYDTEIHAAKRQDAAQLADIFLFFILLTAKYM
jgi:hypothetical protein